MVSLSAPYNEPPDARLMWPGKMILPAGERKRFLTFLHLPELGIRHIIRVNASKPKKDVYCSTGTGIGIFFKLLCIELRQKNVG